MFSSTSVRFIAFSIRELLGVVQLDMMVVGVSTRMGLMEQEREREDPDTNISSSGNTVTTGLGTEEKKNLYSIHKSA